MSDSPKYILGLDIGTNSIGWALLKAAPENGRLEPFGIERTGVRIFEAGVAGSIEQGRTTPIGQDRRMARQMRRNVFRDGQRLRRAFRLLQEAGLLPGDPRKPSKRDAIIKSLDGQLRGKWADKLKREGKNDDEIKVAVNHNLTYLLRARGLDEQLDPHEIGRAFYQLAQRRGFQSSRKNLKSGDDEQDQNSIEKESQILRQKMQECNARTLGEFFSRYNPFEDMHDRIRGKHTVRRMHKEEFELLWAAQSQHHAGVLSDHLKQDLLYELNPIDYIDQKGKKRTRYICGIFQQRPLKPQDHLIGKCNLETNKRRCPMVFLEAQRYRYLQKLNDTLVIEDGVERHLGADEYDRLSNILAEEPFLKFSEARSILGLKKGSKFNFELEGEKSFLGNKTAARFIEVIPDEWRSATLDERRAIVLDYWATKDDVTPMEKTAHRLGLDDKSAKRLSDIKLEQGYCAHSLKALRRLLPDMEQGFSYHEARKNAYGEPEKPVPLDYLPSIDHDVDIRNPIVQRALTELRKVVNAIIRKYGKPELVRIELARDMKKSDKDRKEIWKRNDEQRKKREQAAKEIFNELKIQTPKRSDIEKVLLWKECGGPNAVCPYTEKPIGSISTVLSTQVDVEHIIPFSRCLDDSFMNKTLCDADYNRRIKKNKMPSELSGFQEMVERIERWPAGETRQQKLERFKTAEIADFDDFSTTQLNDTRYASKLACQFLGRLYGGTVDADGKQRIQVGKGAVTHHIRNLWGFNRILSDGPRKSRDDHRHHAVDAVAIAITDPALLKRMSKAAEQAKESGVRWFRRPPAPPWASLLADTTRQIMEHTIISRRVSRKINTGFHQETIYSREKQNDGKTCVHIRRTLGHNLNKGEVEEIVDPRIRDAVKATISGMGFDPDKLSDADWKKIGKAFTAPENLPFIETKNGNRIPVKKVRVRKSESVMQIGVKGKERNVVSGSNNHIEVFETTDAKGKIKWLGRTVSSYEALQRLKRGSELPVVNKVGETAWTFRFSLSGGDLLEIDGDSGSRDLMLIKSIVENGDVKLFPAFNAGKDQGRLPDGKYYDLRKVMSMNTLFRKNARKVIVSPLGEIHYAND